MLRVGLTGSLACGKSTVAELFAKLGAHVINADLIAREFMQPGQQVYNDVAKHFGPEIVQANGQIDRRKLAEKVFGAGRTEELNRIVHPAVIARQEAWMDHIAVRLPEAVAIVDAPLILEAGVRGRFQKIIVVTCDAERQLERFARRASLDLETARVEAVGRMSAQIPQDEKIKAADYVINNSGRLEETAAQVAEVYAKLAALAKSSPKKAQART